MTSNENFGELLNEILTEIKALRAELHGVQGVAAIGAAFMRTATTPSTPKKTQIDEREIWLKSLKDELEKCKNKQR